MVSGSYNDADFSISVVSTSVSEFLRHLVMWLPFKILVIGLVRWPPVLCLNLISCRFRISPVWLKYMLYSVIHEFIPAERANHYMPSLKAGSIV
ncbi:hypothetical protein F2Q69_00007922 [Brassica cretica]|uniref:Uncharacterized protein n=1 Tax=Brassica cretica TaxID=69181 RepID=A0A8S9NW63_BRACR|nr:hypothetical protein F2Q69_00007922 [Brassica cretica]